MKSVSKWLVFSLVAIAQFMVVLDNSIVNVALPEIRQNLGFSQSALQWVVTAYTLTFGGFLLLGGRAADLFGRRRVLMIGLTGFTLFSLLTGLAPSPLLMIIARALQGLMAALMSPSALSVVLSTFRDGKERNRALGYWSVVATAGGAVGLLLGGLLSQYFGWRWNFFINVPVGIGLVLAIRRFVPAMTSDADHRDLDMPGAAFVTSGLITLVLGVSQAPEWGWLSGWTLGLFALGIVLLVAFVRNESRRAHPLVPLSFFKIRNIVGANLMIMFLFATMMSTFFLLTLYTQTQLHYSPLRSGLAFLPFPLIIGFMSNRVSAMVSRFGYKRFLASGPVLIALGLAWLARLPVGGHYMTDILPAMIIMPLGIGMTIMPILAAATSGASQNESGLASGTVTTSQQLGGALGLSILTGLTASVAAANAYRGQAAATVRGYEAAFLVGTGMILLALVVAIWVIRERRRPQNETPSSKASSRSVSAEGAL